MKRKILTLATAVITACNCQGLASSKDSSTFAFEDCLGDYVVSEGDVVISSTEEAETAYVHNVGKNIDNSESIDDLLAKKELSKEEFNGLVSKITTLHELEGLFKKREIIYPNNGTLEWRYATDLEYGAPWNTHNKGQGVCDEIAMYALPFLLNIPEVKDINLVEIEGLVVNENNFKPKARHALIIFRDETNGWRYFTNGDFSAKSYLTQREVIDAAARATSYFIDRTIDDEPLRYFIKAINNTEINGGEMNSIRINSIQNWVYDNNESIKFRPTSEVCLE